MGLPPCCLQTLDFVDLFVICLAKGSLSFCSCDASLRPCMTAFDSSFSHLSSLSGGTLALGSY